VSASFVGCDDLSVENCVVDIKQSCNLALPRRVPLAFARELIARYGQPGSLR